MQPKIYQSFPHFSLLYVQCLLSSLKSLLLTCCFCKVLLSLIVVKQTSFLKIIVAIPVQTPGVESFHNHTQLSTQ